MSEELKNTETSDEQPKRDPFDEEYGWKFHRVPLAIAVVLTGLFYALVFAFVKANPRW